VNELSYGGVSLTAQPTAGGTVAPTTAVTDASGTARFQWTPGPAVTNSLRIAVANGASVTASALGRPSLQTSGVVNAAAWTGAVAPGSIAAGFGTNLTNAEVFVNDVPTTVFFAGTLQVNFLIPASTPVGTARIAVRTIAGQSEAVNSTVASVAPGIFAALPAGRFLEIYATGLGRQPSAASVQVLLGGRPLNVLYSGSAPGFLGLNQINAELPAGVAGVQPLTVVVNGARSNEIAVRVP
jgi:hypothetical protein